VEFDRETRTPVFAQYYVYMVCKVCGLELESSEIDHIVNNFEKFFGTNALANKADWEQAIEEPEFEY